MSKVIIRNFPRCPSIAASAAAFTHSTVRELIFLMIATPDFLSTRERIPWWSGGSFTPHTERFNREGGSKTDADDSGAPPEARARFPRVYWIYLVGIMFLAGGFADFPIIAFHFHQAGTVQADLVPVRGRRARGFQYDVDPIGVVVVFSRQTAMESAC